MVLHYACFICCFAMWNVEGQTRMYKLLLKGATSVDTLLEKG